MYGLKYYQLYHVELAEKYQTAHIVLLTKKKELLHVQLSIIHKLCNHGLCRFKSSILKIRFIIELYMFQRSFMYFNKN
jgi:hypothetical protein